MRYERNDDMKRCRSEYTKICTVDLYYYFHGRRKMYIRSLYLLDVNSKSYTHCNIFLSVWPHFLGFRLESEPQPTHLTPPPI
jgi:hypothetical protein